MSTKPQPFIGGILAGLAVKVGTTAIERVAEQVMKSKDVPQVKNADAAEVAKKIGDASQTVVVDAIKANPVLNAAINGEPLIKSVAFWLGVGGVLSSAGGMITLYFNGVPDGTDAYMTLAGAMVAAIGSIVRRAQFSAPPT